MTNLPSTWHLTRRDELTRLAGDEPLYRAYVSSLFMFVAGRNAWHGTWSSTYPREHAFATQIERLHQQVEKERVQGTTFTIQQLPVLVLCGRQTRLVLSEPSSPMPFLFPEPVETHSRSLGETASHLITRSHVGVACWRTTSAPPEAEPPFLAYHSSVAAAGSPLHWSRSESSVETSAIFRLVDELQRGANAA